MKQLKVMTKMASQKVRVFFELCEILVECYAIRLRSFRKDLTQFKGSQTFERGSVGTKRFPLPDSLHRAAVLRSVKPPVYQKLEASVVANGI